MTDLEIDALSRQLPGQRGREVFTGRMETHAYLYQ
jgi:hypothetical protein